MTFENSKKLYLHFLDCGMHKEAMKLVEKYPQLMPQEEEEEKEPPKKKKAKK